ncbi:MAG TPA: hypothetical protein H9684_08945 [Firmicutes bacterium]|nr:hypothetical protein [Bacillota bacterium]
MTGSQYKNVTLWTLHNTPDMETADTAAAARTIFNNLGVAFPGGSCEDILLTLMSEDYMGWTPCTCSQAQEFANAGVAAVGVDTSRVVVILPDESADSVVGSIDAEASFPSVMQACGLPLAERLGMQFFAYAAATTTTITKNRDYRGLPILSSAELTLVNGNKRFYENAAQSYGVPWKMIAAIHYRESRLKKVGPSNGNGPYQIWGSEYPVGDYSDEQFQDATNKAAQFIKSKAGNRDLNIINNVKYTFFAYNGIASSYIEQAKSLGFNDLQAGMGEGSPYVMNRADAMRDPTVEPTKSNCTWGQIKSDGGSLQYPANSDYGAFVVYNSL